MPGADEATGGRLVVAVGGANGERVYRLAPGEFQPNVKISKEPARDPVLAGGSSLNHSCRLLAMGVDVHPILPLCDDETGARILRALGEAAATGGVSRRFGRELCLTGDGLSTPFTTIVSEGERHTVLNEFGTQLIRAFPEHCERRLKALDGVLAERDLERPDALAIGHVHADRSESPGRSRGLSKSLIERFHAAGVPIFSNLGSSQYRLGTESWKHLLPWIDVFQLEIQEMRRFFSDAHPSGSITLAAMLDWFRDRCTVVISLGRFGAVGQLRHSDSVVFAWPYDLPPEKIADTTGAGDAMGAGLVLRMIEAPFAGDDEAFRRALEFARLCGARACTSPGGSSACPSLEELAAFESDPEHRPAWETQVQPFASARRDLWLLDRAFSE